MKLLKECAIDQASLICGGCHLGTAPREVLPLSTAAADTWIAALL